MLLFVSLSPVTTTFVKAKVICWPMDERVLAAPDGLSVKAPVLPTNPVVTSRAEPKM